MPPPAVASGGAGLYSGAMFFLFIKKAFYDGWDHFFSLAVVNMVGLVLGGGQFFLCYAVLSVGRQQAVSLLEYFVLLLGFCVLSLYFGASAGFAHGVADYQSGGAKAFFRALSKTWLTSALFAAVVFVAVVVANIAFTFYATNGGLLGVLAQGLVFWMALFAVLALQYFFPVQARMGGGLLKCLKRCFLIALDNPLNSLLILVWSLVALALSVFLGGLAPGFSGVLVGQCGNLRLLMLKYDWLEANPPGRGARVKIPWEQILTEERELVGDRGFRGLFFPWKDQQK